MRDYNDELTCEFWIAIGRLALMALLVAVVFAITKYATRVTPEREAELKAQGAAEADRKAAAVGGWSAWIAGEVSANVSTGEAASRSEVARVVQDARCPRGEVR